MVARIIRYLDRTADFVEAIEHEEAFFILIWLTKTHSLS